MNVLEPPEYYKILEITPSASSQEIKKAYKKLALKYHPDKHKQRLSNNTNVTSIDNQFILINEAYSVLAHEESRARYDSMRCKEKISDQELSGYEFGKQSEIQLMREIMAKKEQIMELSESIISFAISMGWIGSNSSSFESEDKLLSTFEREISLIESNILGENAEQDSSDIDLSDFELSACHLPEDDIIQVMENPQWILINKETLVLSEFIESQMLLIKSITAIVVPLMMACTYGSWDEQKINLLQRVSALMTQIIQCLKFIVQRDGKDGKEIESIIIEKMKAQDIQTQISNLIKHPILSKIYGGRFGQNNYPLINFAVLLGPPFAGHSLYWSILAVILLGIITVRRNEGDLKSFQQFLNIFEEIVPLLDNIIEQ